MKTKKKSEYNSLLFTALKPIKPPHEDTFTKTYTDIPTYFSDYESLDKDHQIETINPVTGKKEIHSRPINNVEFNIIDDHSLSLTVKFPKGYSEVTDHQFRYTVGVMGRYNFTTLEINTLLEQYEEFLKRNDLAPPKKDTHFSEYECGDFNSRNAM